jgi:hypothetical protein
VRDFSNSIYLKSIKLIRGDQRCLGRGYRVSRGDVDLPRIAEECRFTADRGGMSIHREPRGNVNSSRITGECRFTANRGGMSIHRESRGNVDLAGIAAECRFSADRRGISTYRGPRRNVDSPRIADECRFTANRGGMSIYRDCNVEVDPPRSRRNGGHGGFHPAPRGLSCTPCMGLLYFTCAGGSMLPRDEGSSWGSYF